MGWLKKSSAATTLTKAKSGGKGKSSAAPLESKFWESKLEDENRQELGAKTYSGTVSKFFFRQGWGLIAPDNFDGLPKKVKEAIEAATTQSIEKAAAAGKEVDGTHTIYFRKPDVNHQE